MVVGKSNYQMYIRFCFISADYGAFVVSGDALFLNINIILKEIFKKLSNSLETLFFVQCQGYENYRKGVKGAQKLFELI